MLDEGGADEEGGFEEGEEVAGGGEGVLAGGEDAVVDLQGLVVVVVPVELFLEELLLVAEFFIGHLRGFGGGLGELEDGGLLAGEVEEGGEGGGEEEGFDVCSLPVGDGCDGGGGGGADKDVVEGEVVVPEGGGEDGFVFGNDVVEDGNKVFEGLDGFSAGGVVGSWTEDSGGAGGTAVGLDEVDFALSAGLEVALWRVPYKFEVN